MKERRRRTDDYLLEFTPHDCGIGLMIDFGYEYVLSFGPFHATWFV